MSITNVYLLLVTVYNSLYMLKQYIRSSVIAI